MTALSCLTPDGQVTIPRSIMKSLGIGGGSSVSISVNNGKLILIKAEDGEGVIKNLETKIHLKA